MSHLIWPAFAVMLVFGLLSWLTIWSRKDTWARPAAIVLFLVGIPIVAAAAVESLGYHRPLWTVYDLAPGKHLVLASKMIQDKAIYLYLDEEARDEPRPLVLPWSNEVANGIQRALDGAPEGMEGQFLITYDGSLATEVEAHPLPQQPEPPAKDTPAPGMVYEQE